MDEKKIKESIDYVIGDSKLFTNQIRNKVLSNALKSKPRRTPLLNRLMPTFTLLFLVIGAVTFTFFSIGQNDKLITANKDNNEVIEEPVVPLEPVNPSHLFMELNSHGKEFQELEDDLRKIMLTPNTELGISEVMNDSINGVSIDDKGMVLVEFKDFRSEVPNPSSELKTAFLVTLYDTIFKYSEVKSAQYSFEGNITTWQEWTGINEPMFRQYVFDLNTHGQSFPELENDLNNLMQDGFKELSFRKIDALKNSLNGVSINEEGIVVIEFKDFRSDLGSLTSNEKGLFLAPISDIIFRYPEVNAVYFTFEESFNDWCEWLEFTYEPMNRYGESLDSGDLSPDSPNFYSLEELAKMTPDELKAIGYPNPNEFEVKTLVAKHSYYKNMYQTLLDAELIDDKAADVFIVFLEALKNKDLNEVKKYAQHSLTIDTNIEALIEKYQYIDYSSFSIESIFHSEGEPVSEVNLTYKQKNGSLSSSQLYIEFYESEIRIQHFQKE